MKVFFIFLLCITSLLAEGIVVTANVEGKGYKAKKSATLLAKKNAIKKYILKKNKNIDKDAIEIMMEEYPTYVMASTLEDLAYEDGTTHATYSIELDEQEINKKLLALGQSIQGLGVTFVIIEEPLDLNSIDFFSKEDFIVYYKYLQKGIQDTIHNKLNDSGYKILDISRNPKFNNAKKRNENLTGVYFNAQRKKFVEDQEFFGTLKKEYPNVIFIKYQIKSLSLINQNIKATLSLGLSDLMSAQSLSLDNLSYAVPVDSLRFHIIKESFLQAVSNIVSLSLNDLDSKISEIIEAKNNQPLFVSIAVTSKKIGYKIKSDLSKNERIFDITFENNKLKFYSKGSDSDEFLYGTVLPLLEDKLNMSIQEKYIFIQGKNIFINTDDIQFEKNQNIKIIFI